MNQPEVRSLVPPSESEIKEANRKRGTILTDYIAGLDVFEREATLEWAEQLFDQGGYLPQLVAITPVAAHQERPETILRAMEQYAGQKDAGEFAIILGFNYPPTEMGHPLIAANYDALAKARKLYPQLDIRVLEECYGDFTIGGVRRDLWNAAVALVDKRTQEVGYRETLGMTHDIDLVTMSPHFLQSARSFQNFITMHQALILENFAEGMSRPFRSRSKHAYDSRFPNIGRATLWSDVMHSRADIHYEAGTFFPFIYYAQQGGYDPAAVLGETHELYYRGGVRMSPEVISYTNLDSVYSATSNRRYVEALQAGDLSTIWTDENFTNQDQYRTSIDGFKDISKDSLGDIIKPNLHSSIEKMMQKSLEFAVRGRVSPESPDKAALLIRRDMRFIQRLLGETLGLQELVFYLNQNFGLHETVARQYHIDRLIELGKSRPKVEKLVDQVLKDVAVTHEGSQDLGDA